MRRTVSASIAALSLLVAWSALYAARRPRYGGVLRIELRTAVESLDPSDQSADSVTSAAKHKLAGAVFETLVRMDENGEPRPLLATSWVHDAPGRRWVFSLRANVVLHNGEPWDQAGGTVSFPDDRPIGEILRGLSRLQRAVVAREADGSLVGTGPFKVARWEPGKTVVLAAHENYWGGRPFLDFIEVRLAQPVREQALHFDLGQADVVEIAVTDLRRLRQTGARVAASAPIETLALVFAKSSPMAERLALSIDRSAIHQVLLQRQGDVTAALLPQWLSGYAFLFPVGRNLAGARLAGGGGAPLTLHYDRDDAVARPIAERIALNASEAGLTVHAVGTGLFDARLVRLRITQPNPRMALEEFAAAWNAPLPDGADAYEIEQALLAGSRVIPLAHLPVGYRIGERVHNWMGARWMRADQWRLADVWLDEGERP